MPTGGQIVTLFVAVFLMAILLPVAFDQIFNANTTGWDTDTVTIWDLIPLIVVVVIIIGLLAFFRGD
jgi:hypothetical protein